ncbi:MAG: hypothetical protein Q4E12_04585 [Coriobacteriia bacterium]|nr:hypothetical protein [Coriobacteriia bacterium]
MPIPSRKPLSQQTFLDGVRLDAYARYVFQTLSRKGVLMEDGVTKVVVNASSKDTDAPAGLLSMIISASSDISAAASCGAAC